MRYAEILMTENSNKLEHIAKAKINDLKVINFVHIQN